MKKIIFTLVTVVMCFCMYTAVLADYLYDLDVFENSAGQCEMRITVKGSSEPSLVVYAREHNVYCKTSDIVFTRQCRGREYVGITYDSYTKKFGVLWVDSSNLIWVSPYDVNEPKYLGLYDGKQPINSLGTAAANLDDDGPLMTAPGTGNNGTASLDSTLIPTRSVNREYVYRYDGTVYKYVCSGGRLEFVNSSSRTGIASNIKVVGFVDKYLLYLNDDEELFAVELGKLNKGVMIYEDVTVVNKSANGSDVIESVVSDGDVISSSELAREARRGLKNK